MTPMATISPFRGWRYAPERVRIQEVVTQPYDKITPLMQENYYQASPYNLVRIILGKRQANETESENVYTRAASSFQKWRGEGVLKQDVEPSLYRYSQTFQVPGSNVPGSNKEEAKVGERRGFIGLGRLEEYSAGVVYRHEQTLSKPKADRLNLLRSTHAHFGQIFMLYSGGGRVDSLLESAAGTAPDIDIRDEYNVEHRVWKISDPGLIAATQEEMRAQKLIIADGHHRYETALAYRAECRQRDGVAEAGDHGSAPHDYAMMTFVDMDCPGLVILPTHRAVFGMPQETISKFREEARQFFNVEEVDAGIDGARAVAILREAGIAGTALLAIGNEKAFLLHTPRAIGTSLFGDLSLKQQALDVVQLHKCLLENCLGISEEALRNQQNVAYFREAEEALARVRDGGMQMAFLMNPVRMQQVRDIALGNEVLPQKSTDFYPKLLSGLAIYALD
jgi:uncharacterized protein (DUF1015 family)